MSRIRRPANDPVKLATDILYSRVAADGQCWWTCTSIALGITKGDLRREMEVALRTVNDATTLFELGMTFMPGGPSSRVAPLVSSFLHPDGDFMKFKNGGAVEMRLLSFARGGQIRFVCISSNANEPPQEHYFKPSSMSAVAARARITTDIALHHCSSFGFRHASKRQHWNLLVDGRGETERAYWPVVADESGVERTHRHRLMADLGAHQLAEYARVYEADLEATIALLGRGGLEVPTDVLEQLAVLKADWKPAAPPVTSSSSPLPLPTEMDETVGSRGVEPYKSKSKGNIGTPTTLSAFIDRLPAVERRMADGSEVPYPKIDQLERHGWTKTHWNLPHDITNHHVSNDWSTWEEQRWCTGIMLPFVLLPDASEDLRWAKVDPEIKTYPRRVMTSLRRAYAMMKQVKPAHAILATAIHDYTPVHFYVQFVANSTHAAWVVSPQDCRTEFLQLFRSFLVELCNILDDDELEQLLLCESKHNLWLRRETDSAGALEIQYHRSNVAFHLADLHTLMQRFRMFLETKALQLCRRNQEPMMLCRLTEESCYHPVSNELLRVACFQHLINFQAYQPGHLLCLPGNHAPGVSQRLLRWPHEAKKDKTTATNKKTALCEVTERDMLFSQPHVCVPSVVTRPMSTRAQSADPFSNSSWFDTDERMSGSDNYNNGEEEEEEEEYGLISSTLPVVMDLRALRNTVFASAADTPASCTFLDATPVVHESVWKSVLPLSKRVNACVRHILVQHLGKQHLSFVLRLCERNSKYPCLRGFVELEGSPLRCPCCNRPPSSQAQEAKQWDTSHADHTVPFSLSRGKLTLLCPAGKQQALHCILTAEQKALLNQFVAFSIEDRPLGDSTPTQVVAPLDSLHMSLPAVQSHSAMMNEQLLARLRLPDFMPRTAQERHATVLQSFQEASPEIRALLQQGCKKYFGWTLQEMAADDFRARGPPNGPTTVLGPWTPRNPTFEEEMEHELDVSCKRDSSLDEQVRADLARDMESIRQRFGSQHSKILNRPRLCKTNNREERDELVNLLLEKRFVYIKAPQGAGKSWLLDQGVETFVERILQHGAANHLEFGSRILWVSCRRMYGMATYLRLKLVSNRLAKRGIHFEFQLYMDEQWRRGSADIPPSAQSMHHPKQQKKKKRTLVDQDTPEATSRKRAKGASGGPVSDPLSVPSPTNIPTPSSCPPSRLGDQQAVVCSLESIERLKETADSGAPKRYDLVILDEVEELRFNFHGGKTMGDKRVRIFQQLKLILQQAKFIWAADADLDVSSENVGGIRFLETMLHQPGQAMPQFYLIWNRYASVRRQYIFHPQGDVGESSCVTALVRSLCSRRCAVVVTNSLQKAKLLAYHCRHHPLLRALFASGEFSMSLLTGETPQEDKWQFMSDKRMWRVQLLIYSPVISSGVDFCVPEWTRPWFHEAFMFGVDGSSTVRQLFQQLNRVRQLTLNRVHVHLHVNPRQWAELPDSFDSVLADTIIKLRRCKGFQLKGHQLDVRPDDIDPLTRDPLLNISPGSYNILYVINELEENRSRRHFERLLMLSMIVSGGSIYHVTYGVSADEEQRIMADHKEVKQQEYERIVHATDWTPEQVDREERLNARGQRTSPGFRIAVAKFHLKRVYGCEELTVDFVQRFHSDAVMHKFLRLQEQARDGSQALEGSLVDRVRNGEEAPEHCLSRGICNLDTQTLLCAAGFVAVVAMSGSVLSRTTAAAAAVVAVPTVTTAVTIAGEPLGDLFHTRPVAEADIVKRLTPGTASHDYWWSRLLRVQSFTRAIEARVRKNRDSLRKKLNTGGATANDLESEKRLAELEVGTHPQAWSGDMKSAVLLDALRSLLRHKYGLKVKIVYPEPGSRMLQLDHSFWNLVKKQLEPTANRFRRPKCMMSIALLGEGVHHAAPVAPSIPMVH
jgi:hypothetical protein